MTVPMLSPQAKGTSVMAHRVRKTPDSMPIRRDAYSALTKLHDLGLESVSRDTTAHTFHAMRSDEIVCIAADATVNDVSQGASAVKNSVKPVVSGGSIAARIALPNPPTARAMSPKSVVFSKLRHTCCAKSHRHLCGRLRHMSRHELNKVWAHHWDGKAPVRVHYNVYAPDLQRS